MPLKVAEKANSLQYRVSITPATRPHVPFQLQLGLRAIFGKKLELQHLPFMLQDPIIEHTEHMVQKSRFWYLFKKMSSFINHFRVCLTLAQSSRVFWWTPSPALLKLRQMNLQTLRLASIVALSWETLHLIRVSYCYPTPKHIGAPSGPESQHKRQSLKPGSRM